MNYVKRHSRTPEPPAGQGGRKTLGSLAITALVLALITPAAAFATSSTNEPTTAAVSPSSSASPEATGTSAPGPDSQVTAGAPEQTPVATQKPTTPATSPEAPGVPAQEQKAPEQAPAPTTPARVHTAETETKAGPASVQALAATTPLQCSPTGFYTVQEDGTLSLGNFGSTSTSKVGKWNITNVEKYNSAANSLGISPGGTAAYAVERPVSGGNSQSLRILSFVASTGSFTVGPLINVGGDTGRIVAGAVDPISGDFYFGGHTYSDERVVLYRYSVSTKVTTLVGAVTPKVSGSSTANGDFAFDSLGNLNIIYSKDSQNKLVPVPRANLLNPLRGVITAAPTQPSFSTASDIAYNGIAFLPNGQVIVQGTNGSSETIIRSIDPNTGSSTSGNFRIFSSSQSNGTDLGSCTFPPTISLSKNLVGPRAAASDQFTLEILQNGSAGVIASAVTTGNASGVQKEVAGPVPAATGTSYTIRETISANASRYASTFRCFWGSDPGAPDVFGGALTGAGSVRTATVPNVDDTRAGQNLSCVIVNVAAAPATVKISKTVVDASGTNPVPGIGWNLGATVTGAGVSATPAIARQLTTAAVPAPSWTLGFDTITSKASVTISEDAQDGYVFVSGKCDITPANGITRTISWANSATKVLDAVVPADSVNCVLTNKQVAGFVSWTKVDEAGALLGGSEWTLTKAGGAPLVVTDCVSAPCTGADQDPAVGKFLIGGLAWGTYSLKETKAPAGYTISSTDKTIIVGAGNTSAAKAASIGAISNAAKTGYLSWTKVDADNKPLAGSEWILSAPGKADIIVTDCTAAPCTGRDTDPAPGKFLVKDLPWGNYSLKETKAPDGYALDTTVRNASVGASNTDPATPATFGNIVNVRQKGWLSWSKTAEDGTRLSGSEWTLTSPGKPTITITDCTAGPCTGADKDPREGEFLLQDLDWGTYTLKETRAPAGYSLATGTFTATIGLANTTRETAATFGGITNKQILGTLSFSKASAEGQKPLLGGSEWKLTGPGLGTGLTITDCTSAPCAAGVGKDQDPTPGRFQLKDLAWGDYTLVETTAPLGYQLDSTSHTFSIGATNLNAVFGDPFLNQQRPPINVPFTGGLGSDAFLIGGLVLLTLGGGAAGVVLYRRRAHQH